MVVAGCWPPRAQRLDRGPQPMPDRPGPRRLRHGGISEGARHHRRYRERPAVVGDAPLPGARRGDRIRTSRGVVGAIALEGRRAAWNLRDLLWRAPLSERWRPATD